MNSTKCLIRLLFLEFTVYFICAQDSNVNFELEVEEEDEDYNSTVPIDEEDDAVSQLNNVQTLSQFLPLLRQRGHSLTWGDLFSEYPDSSGKVVIQGGGRMAEPDECSPRNSTVRLRVESTEHNVIHFPRCTKVERCGGCCASPHLQCRPAYTERVGLQVVKAQVPYPGSPHLVYKGFATVIVERHVTCRVVCTLNRSRCGRKKIFRRNQCKCQCRRYQNCNPPKIWDAEECGCKCQSVRDCCGGEERCNFVFNHDICQCRDSGRIIISSGPVNGTEEDIGDYSRPNQTTPNEDNVNGSPNNGDNDVLPDGTTLSTSTTTEATTMTSSTTPSTTTTISSSSSSSSSTTTPTPTPTVTTSTSSSASTTTARPSTASLLDRCGHVRCPPTFRTVVRHGSCFCRPDRSRSRPRIRYPFRQRGANVY